MISDGRKENVQDIVAQIENFDYNSFLHSVQPIVAICFANYFARKAFKNFSIHRELKPKNVSKILPPPELKEVNREIDIESICAKEFGDKILRFIKVIIENFNPEVLNNFYNNLKTIKVSSKSLVLRNFLLHTNAVGTYNPKHNEIAIATETDDTTITHELLHMASSFYKDKMSRSGFNQFYSKGLLNIGNGINEGYTELLNQRYFGGTEYPLGIRRSISTYGYLKLITEKLEQIVGKEKMENLYFSANLKGLIQELNKYASEEEIMKFITDTDFIIKYLSNKRPSLIENQSLINCMNRSTIFLITNYIKMLILQEKEGIISNEELREKANDYIKSIPHKIIRGKYEYVIYDSDDINSSIESALEYRESLYASK